MAKPTLFVYLFAVEDGSEVILKKGEAVKVIRASEKRGYLVVEHKNTTVDLPFQVMELKVRRFFFFVIAPLAFTLEKRG